jgi:hypothetical protein
MLLSLVENLIDCSSHVGEMGSPQANPFLKIGQEFGHYFSIAQIPIEK